MKSKLSGPFKIIYSQSWAKLHRKVINYNYNYAPNKVITITFFLITS